MKNKLTALERAALAAADAWAARRAERAEKPTACENCRLRPGGVIKVDDNGNCATCGKFIAKITALTPASIMGPDGVGSGAAADAARARKARRAKS